MSLLNLPVTHREKPVSAHPWSKIIKDEYANKIKYAHNSIRNVVYPKPKEKIPPKKRIRFTVIGNRVTKEFIYCVHLVKGMHKYRWQKFDKPVIRGVTGVEWPHVLEELKYQYEGVPFCNSSPVVVLRNDCYLGNEADLKKLIETKYCYHIALNYQRESVWQFIRFVKSTGRPCAYFHIALGEDPIGTLIFMLYSDVCPVTCENFLRLCNSRRGGYSGTPIHRIVKDSWIQCGGFGLKSTNMNCENFIVPHDRRGVLGMCNAGRHIDCSTQFFVLLQPAQWMKGRFVAFGQLIDGEQTLRRIERVPTFYESPTLSLNIYRAGILNVDCRDIKINKHSNEYIESHIEDLVAIGDIFYQMLMERVFLEIEFRIIAKLESKAEDEEEPLQNTGTPGEAEGKDIRATQRFIIRNKNEIQAQVENKKPTEKSAAPVTVIEKFEKDDDENNDFDVEDYTYEDEEYPYDQVTPSAAPEKAKIPFYIPLTDVPYPGEVNSEFDLKRFLQGDYCLESDLDRNAVKAGTGTHYNQEKLNDLSDALAFYKQAVEDEDEDMKSDDDFELDSDEEREIKKYLTIYGEKISFPGVVVRKIARSHAHRNPLEYDAISFTDEEVRRLKLGIVDMKSRENKRVSIAKEPWEAPHQKIKRRQTGFMRPDELRELLKRQMEEEDEEDDEEDVKKEKVEKEDDQERQAGQESKRRTRTVSIALPDEEPAHEIKRRPTGFVHPEDLAKIISMQKRKYEDDDDEDDEKPGLQIQTDAGARDNKISKVKIIKVPHEHVVHKLRHVESEDSLDDDKEITRKSVLVRLFDDVAQKGEQELPTLKQYKPIEPKKNLLLTLAGGVMKSHEFLQNENYFRSSLTPDDDFDHILAHQYEHTMQRKLSSDYAKPMERLERRPYDFGRTRPSLSVSEYQMKNQLRAMEAKKSQKDEHVKKAAATGKTPK